MNHPAKEQWMDFLYGEFPPAQQEELQRHLDACAECRQQVDAWRGTMAALDAWPMPADAAPPAGRKPASRFLAFRWAAAAAVVVGVGFGLGRFSAPAPDLAGLESRMRQEFAQQLAAQQSANREALAGFAAGLKEERAADRRAVVGLMQELSTRNQSELAELRRDLETVAVMTDGSLRRAQDQLVKFATWSGGESQK